MANPNPAGIRNINQLLTEIAGREVKVRDLGGMLKHSPALRRELRATALAMLDTAKPNTDQGKHLDA